MVEEVQPFSLDAALVAIQQKNDEDRDGWGKYQEEQRQKINASLKNLSDADIKFQQGIRAVDFARQQLADLADTPLTGEHPQLFNFELNRMAEGYALQGDYLTALMFVKDEDKKAEYQAVQDAIMRPDDETCPCEKDGKGTNAAGKAVKFSTMFIKDTFYSQHHGQVVNLWKCSTCPFMNARP